MRHSRALTVGRRYAGVSTAARERPHAHLLALLIYRALALGARHLAGFAERPFDCAWNIGAAMRDRAICSAASPRPALAALN